MMHWNYLALSLWLLAPHFQNICSPLIFTHGPITTLWRSSWLSSVFAFQWWRMWESCQAYGRFESKEWELREPLYMHTFSNTWVMSRHNYSEVLLTLLASLASYVEWLYLTIWGNWFKFDIVVYQVVFENFIPKSVC